VTIYPKGSNRLSMAIEKNKVYLLNAQCNTKKQVFAWSAFSKKDFRGRPCLTIKADDLISMGGTTYVKINWRALAWLNYMATCDGRMVISYRGKSHLRRIPWIIESGNMFYINDTRWGFGLYPASLLGVLIKG